MNKYFGFSAQDYFVEKILKGKKNGTFLELGSHHPVGVNNTFLLEAKYGWKGLMIEYEASYIHLYPVYRPNSSYIFDDARNIDYKEQLEWRGFPKDLDYLSFDLEVENRSTLDVLEIFEKSVLPSYRFATITFEHDYYRENYIDYFETRRKSREIFEKFGYIRVFSDVMCKDSNGEYEDWYVHPELVDMNVVNRIKSEKPMHHSEIERILDTL
jgi:hypothetical protein